MNNTSYNYDVDDTEPKAFINLLFMPENASDMVAEGNFAYKQVSAASNGQHAVMALEEAFEAPATGYVVVYLSNESSQYTEVYFDDLEVSIEQGHVIQSTDYYPFGGQQATSWTRVSAQDNLRLYNAGSELNKLTQNYETFYRQYDPMLGRFNGIDIKAVKYANQSPYQFAGNNPVSNNDPMGDDYNPPPPRHIPGYPGAHETRGPSGAGNGSGFFGFGGPIGPGSGNHWSGAFSNPYRDYFLMGSIDFDNKYGSPDSQRRSEIASGYGNYMGRGLGGLSNAMLATGAASVQHGEGFGLFSYEFNGKIYGGDYHTLDGKIASIAVSQISQHSSGAWFGVSGRRIYEYGSNGNQNGGYPVTNDRLNMFDYFPGGKYFWNTHMGRDIKSLIPRDHQPGGETIMNSGEGGDGSSTTADHAGIIVDPITRALPDKWSARGVFSLYQRARKFLETDTIHFDDGFTVGDTMYLRYPDSVKIPRDVSNGFMPSDKIIWE